MTKRFTLFVRVWRERREGGGPMIMLADRTGEVPKFAFLPSLQLFDLRCLADLECWTLDLTSPTTPSLSLTAAASSRQVFLKADNKRSTKDQS